MALLVICNNAITADLSVDRDSLLQQPIFYGSYAPEPKLAVLDGMKRYGWSEFEVSGDSLVAQLLYKGYDIRVNITYGDGKVLLSPISAQRVGCNRPCSVDKNKRYGWTVNLRKSIAKELHVMAIRDGIKSDV